MERFRTSVSIEPSRYRIQLSSPVFTTGSCFSDAIGQRLKRFKFPVRVNTFGTSYNPISIHNALTYAVDKVYPSVHSYTQSQGVCVNFDFHSTFASLTKEDCAKKIEKTIDDAHAFLRTAEFVFITYGTTWVYERMDTNEIVANCHKLPAKQFQKRLLTQDEIIKSFATLHKNLSRLNPNAAIILTVSPVRHLKDTLELNGVSKAMLRAFCHEAASAFPGVEYFPSYEIMMDDLRDYRFYHSDMIHPSEEAEDYIWEQFMGKYFTKKETEFVNGFEKVLRAIHHRPFNANSEAHQQFVRETQRKLQEYRSLVNVDDEMELLNRQLK
jgi:hypothetical protein